MLERIAMMRAWIASYVCVYIYRRVDDERVIVYDICVIGYIFFGVRLKKEKEDAIAGKSKESRKANDHQCDGAERVRETRRIMVSSRLSRLTPWHRRR